MENSILTIGHSSRSWPEFESLLKSNSVTAVADVRSSPYSRLAPHFNRNDLKQSLKINGISYVFLGKELGGRPEIPDLYSHGIADYEKMSRSDLFNEGIDRVIKGARKHRIALMCAEHNPEDCHRCLLVGRRLHDLGVCVTHIVDLHNQVSHLFIEEKLLQLSGNSEADFFSPRFERLAAAYKRQNYRVGYSTNMNEKIASGAFNE
jgi:uncharacterized protein (DUF488 family)